MRVVVDRELCEGNERCVAEAPEVFHVDDDGVLHLLIERPDESLRAAVQRACDRCPRAALSIDDGRSV